MHHHPGLSFPFFVNSQIWLLYCSDFTQKLVSDEHHFTVSGAHHFTASGVYSLQCQVHTTLYFSLLFFVNCSLCFPPFPLLGFLQVCPILKTPFRLGLGNHLTNLGLSQCSISLLDTSILLLAFTVLSSWKRGSKKDYKFCLIYVMCYPSTFLSDFSYTLIWYWEKGGVGVLVWNLKSS